jgi:predicted DNA binding CopG/RHH family protein
MKKPRSGPNLITAEAAEAFLEDDLSDPDPSQFRLLSFEAERKTERVTMRVPAALLAAVKAQAAARGVPYQRLIREAMERAARGA